MGQCSPAYLIRVKPETPFQGGELVFFADRVKLCGVSVVSITQCSQMETILNALKPKRTDVCYKSFDGNAQVKLVAGAHAAA